MWCELASLSSIQSATRRNQVPRGRTICCWANNELICGEAIWNGPPWMSKALSALAGSLGNNPPWISKALSGLVGSLGKYPLWKSRPLELTGSLVNSAAWLPKEPRRVLCSENPSPRVSLDTRRFGSSWRESCWPSGVVVSISWDLDDGLMLVQLRSKCTVVSLEENIAVSFSSRPSPSNCTSNVSKEYSFVVERVIGRSEWPL